MFVVFYSFCGGLLCCGLVGCCALDLLIVLDISFLICGFVLMLLFACRFVIDLLFASWIL